MFVRIFMDTILSMIFSIKYALQYYYETTTYKLWLMCAYMIDFCDFIVTLIVYKLI
jgi:hypothetical protein